jgi:alkylated DNA repair dioxygenase AlkB
MEPLTRERDLRQEFEQNDFVVVRSLACEADVARLLRDATRLAESGWALKGDRLVPETPASYGFPVMERFLEDLRPSVESISGASLWPTYSYFRLYKNEDELGRHVDREACEISVSLNLGLEPRVPWPFGISGRQGETWVDLWPGDGVVYRGIQCAHWREPYRGRRAVQLFLHYVIKGGPYDAWKFDKRPGLSDGRAQPLRPAAPGTTTPAQAPQGSVDQFHVA